MVTGLTCFLYSLDPYYLISLKRATPRMPSLSPTRELLKCSHPGSGCYPHPQGTVVCLKVAVFWFSGTLRQARGSQSLEEHVPQHIFIVLWCLRHLSRSLSAFLAHASELCSLHFKLPLDLCFGNQCSARALLDFCFENRRSAPCLRCRFPAWPWVKSSTSLFNRVPTCKMEVTTFPVPDKFCEVNFPHISKHLPAKHPACRMYYRNKCFRPKKRDLYCCR